MIETDGQPTIASRRSDPLLEKALEAGGHLADDVARVLLCARCGEPLAPGEDHDLDSRITINGERVATCELEETLRSEHPELD